MAATPPIDAARLVAEHHEAVYRYAYRLTGSVADAEDLTQQTFLAAHQKLHQLRNAEKGRAWLFAILRNFYRKLCRRSQPVSAAALEIEVDAIPAEIEESPIDEERLQLALDDLGDEFKFVLLLFYFEGLSYREIAAELDIPLGTVMSRLSRAKRHLRCRLFSLNGEEMAPRGPHSMRNHEDVR